MGVIDRATAKAHATECLRIAHATAEAARACLRARRELERALDLEPRPWRRRELEDEIAALNEPTREVYAGDPGVDGSRRWSMRLRRVVVRDLRKAPVDQEWILYASLFLDDDEIVDVLHAYDRASNRKRLLGRVRALRARGRRLERARRR